MGKLTLFRKNEEKTVECEEFQNPSRKTSWSLDVSFSEHRSPGPAAYSPPTMLGEAPGYSFGTQARDYGKSLSKLSGNSPGPCFLLRSSIGDLQVHLFP